MAVANSNNDLLLFLKQDCETCQLVKPVVDDLKKKGVDIEVYVQDYPDYYEELSPNDDTSLEASFNWNVETTPTLIQTSGKGSTLRVEGWDKKGWQDVLGVEDLGENLPDFRPGCGSKSREPGVYENLMATYGDVGIQSRGIELGNWDDDMEICYERGWTDGLPVTPPTDARIWRMLQGTNRKPDEVIGKVPPNLAPITVEKAAINAVLAGCKPEYFPVVIAALEAALDPVFTMHGLLCTTCFSSPIIVINGPIAKSIGMNWGMNVLGQGNRANATIGRALQLIIRNVGGGVPGDLDRSTFGGPGKYTFCFAEDETDDSWESLSVTRGFEKGENTVTLFQGDGIQGFIDQRSQTPEQITKSLASSLLAVGHPKLAEFTNAMLVLSPEHYEIYKKEGWDRNKITEALHKEMIRPGSELIQGAGGIGEGIDTSRADEMVNKFWLEGLLIVRAGGKAGLYSAICAGWTGGRFRHESKPVTKKITL
ncbi:MAG: thioredoxin family protein [Ekhidna sp.]|nr:thioredoxin family protein [Ekhidna sp.]MBC6426597.1 thioredoxin family protein [Ekhidna sp.]